MKMMVSFLKKVLEGASLNLTTQMRMRQEFV
jgi:hypothetical protein